MTANDETGRDLLREWREAWSLTAPDADAPDASTIVALLRAGCKKDYYSIALLAGSVNIYALLCSSLALTSAIGEATFGSAEAFDAWLADWQRGDATWPSRGRAILAMTAPATAQTSGTPT